MGRSKLDALKKTTLNTFFEVCTAWQLKANKDYTFNGSSNIITFYNGSEIILKDLFLYPSDRNFDSLGSLEITSAFIDEANQITEKAKNIGLINDAVDQQQLDQKISDVCSEICQKSLEVLAMGKKSFYKQSEMPLSDAYDFTSAQMVENLTLNDANEGISAFIEKRDPNWQDS